MAQPKRKHKQGSRGRKPETLQLNDSFEVAVKKALGRGKYTESNKVGTDKRVKKK
jgi:hypothetical protein